MKGYIINNLNNEDFALIITLLDYETRISECLKSIKIPTFFDKKLLVDTVLCSGLNKYRFIDMTLNIDGTINTNDYKYIDVNNTILEKANEIICNEKISLNTSILTIPQKESLRCKIN